MKTTLKKSLHTGSKRRAFRLLATCYSLLAVGCSLPGSAQDINFSQFFELPLLRNPALAGLFEGDVKVTGVFRNQWNSVTVPYKTRGLGLEAALYKSDNTLVAGGLQVVSDAAGDSKLSRTSVMGTCAVHVAMGNGYLAVGGSGGAVLQKFDSRSLRWDDQYVNGSYSPANPTAQTFGGSFPTVRNYADVAAGVQYNAELNNGLRFYIGGSGFHLNTPSRTFKDSSGIADQSKVKTMINGGLSIPHGDFNRVVFYADYFMQGGARQFQGGLLYKLNVVENDADKDLGISFSFGAFARWADAFIPMLKLDYYNLAVGATYDVNISKLSNVSTGRGGFEITAGYRYFNEQRLGIKCPKF